MSEASKGAIAAMQSHIMESDMSGKAKQVILNYINLHTDLALLGNQFIEDHRSGATADDITKYHTQSWDLIKNAAENLRDN